MMFTRPERSLSLAFTTTLMLSGLREGSHRLKAWRQTHSSVTRWTRVTCASSTGACEQKDTVWN